MTSPKVQAATATTTERVDVDAVAKPNTEPVYLQPGWFTRNMFNRIVAGFTRIGVSVWGSRVLLVQGRKSGEWRSVPVNLLEVGGERFLVAPRGTTQWVRNLRHSGTGELVLGRQTVAFTANEVENAGKEAILRPYLRRWKFEVGAFFDGVDHNSDSAEFARIASNHPVFRINS